jgi:hypothetical protein
MKLRPLAYFIEHAPELLGTVSGEAWYIHTGSGTAADSKNVVVTADQYRTAKQLADDFRRMRSLVGQQTAEPVPDIETLLEEAVSKERAAREAFAKAFQEYEDNHLNIEPTLAAASRNGNRVVTHR